MFTANLRVFVIAVSLLLLMGSILAMAQAENVIYRFKGGSDGMEPLGSLISDNAGNFYGTTCGNDSTVNGTVFQVAINGGRWTETTLHAFASGNGSCPYGELIFDPAGNLYGTGFGQLGASSTVFQLKPPAVQGDSWTETVFFSFANGDYLNDEMAALSSS
ncbi:MAG: choice-of-anchor tandem repeat GloVer-containing protein [Candidatus Sulfotelmatobacter sp.]